MFMLQIPSGISLTRAGGGRNAMQGGEELQHCRRCVTRKFASGTRCHNCGEVSFSFGPCAWPSSVGLQDITNLWEPWPSIGEWGFPPCFLRQGWVVFKRTCVFSGTWVQFSKYSIEFIFVETNEVVRSNSWSWRGKPVAIARAGLQEANAERWHSIFPYEGGMCS